jgi:N-acetylglucosaminyldiphosphoundecaprenol N-acetyl-beta-D-mannosaminyltransferase
MSHFEVPRFNVLGAPIAATNYEEACAAILAAAQARRPFCVSALAVHGVMTGVLDRVHAARLAHFDLLLPDGQPVRWALRWLHGQKLGDRVYGPRLMRELCGRAADEQLPVFFYGSTPDVLSRVRQNLLRRYPRLNIAGMEPSKFRRVSADERDATVAAIKGSGARLTFVGLGCPRQEVWAFENSGRLGMPVVAVGAAFPFEAGTVAQAPLSLQRAGLEWAFRFAQEPRRLWRRYLLLNPLYLTLLGAQAAGLHTFAPPVADAPEQRFG